MATNVEISEDMIDHCKVKFTSGVMPKLVSGEFGSGKTHISNYVAKEFSKLMSDHTEYTLEVVPLEIGSTQYRWLLVPLREDIGIAFTLDKISDAISQFSDKEL